MASGSPNKGLLGKWSEKAKDALRMVPPAERKQANDVRSKSQSESRQLGRPRHGSGQKPASGIAKTKQPSKAAAAESEMDVEVEGSQERQTYINQSPVGTTVSNSQAVEGSRSLLSPSPGPHNPTEDKHKETLQQRRYPSRTDRREVHVHQEKKRKAR